MAYHTVWRHKQDSSFVIWLDIADDYIDEVVSDDKFLDAFDEFLDSLQRDNPEIQFPSYTQFERVATKFYIP